MTMNQYLSDYLQTVGSPKIPSNLYGSDYIPMGGYLPNTLTMSNALGSINSPVNIDTTNLLGNQVLGIPTAGSFSGVNLGTDGMFGNKLVGSTPTTAVTGLDLPKGTGFGDLAFSDKALLGLGALNSALSAINSYKANKLGRQQLAFAKDSFNRNFDAQKGLINSQLADRQAIRNRVNPERNASVADYMAQYGVK